MNSYIQGDPEKMSVRKKGTNHTNGHFLGHLVGQTAI